MLNKELKLNTRKEKKTKFFSAVIQYYLPQKFPD